MLGRARRGHGRHLRRLAGAGDLRPRDSGSRATRCGRSCTFLLNALLFVLIGLQLPLILDGLEDEPLGELLGYARRGQRRR